jgi:hypothetical protein
MMPFNKIVALGYLVIALVCIQGMRLHMHTDTHTSSTPDHAHLGQAHFSYDASEAEHPDEGATIDLSQQGLLKKSSLGSLAIALLMALFVLWLPRLCAHALRRRNHTALFIPGYASLPPTSCGPPL